MSASVSLDFGAGTGIHSSGNLTSHRNPKSDFQNMKQTLNDLVEDMALECAVCMNNLDVNSRMLPCQHTFCTKCLQGVKKAKGFLECPKCRLKVKKKIERLPTNIFLVQFLDTIKERKAKQPTLPVAAADRPSSNNAPVVSNSQSDDLSIQKLCACISSCAHFAPSTASFYQDLHRKLSWGRSSYRQWQGNPSPSLEECFGAIRLILEHINNCSSSTCSFSLCKESKEILLHEASCLRGNCFLRRAPINTHMMQADILKRVIHRRQSLQKLHAMSSPLSQVPVVSAPPPRLESARMSSTSAASYDIPPDIVDFATQQQGAGPSTSSGPLTLRNRLLSADSTPTQVIDFIIMSKRFHSGTSNLSCVSKLQKQLSLPMCPYPAPPPLRSLTRSYSTTNL